MSSSGKDIILDEDAFKTAVSEFEQVAAAVKELRSDILAALEELRKGFDTPAGAKFYNSCNNNLLGQLENQEQVVSHLCNTLNDVVNEYSGVFTEYDRLNTKIKSYK